MVHTGVPSYERKSGALTWRVKAKANEVILYCYFPQDFCFHTFNITIYLEIVKSKKTNENNYSKVCEGSHIKCRQCEGEGSKFVI